MADDITEHTLVFDPDDPQQDEMMAAPPPRRRRSRIGKRVLFEAVLPVVLGLFLTLVVYIILKIPVIELKAEHSGRVESVPASSGDDIALLFTAAAVDFQNDLESGNLSQKWRDAFEMQVITLLGGVTIETMNEGKRWQITAENKVYIVEREGEALKVYSGALIMTIEDKEGKYIPVVSPGSFHILKVVVRENDPVKKGQTVALVTRVGGIYPAFWEKLRDRGPIPAICTFFLFWHLTLVFIRYLFVLLPETKILRENVIFAGADEITDEEMEDIAIRAADIEEHRGGSLLTKRILLAVAHLEIKRDTGELGDLLRRRAEADRLRAGQAYAIPGFLFWAIPILGFIGTVVGIGGAVPKLGSMLKGAGENVDVTSAIAAVAGDLGVAFDTTLVALIMSMFALLAMTLVKQQEGRLLADVEDYLTYRLQSRIRSESPLINMEDALAQMMTNMKEEQVEASRMTMQTMMSTHDSLREALAELPKSLTSATEANTKVLVDTQNQLAQLADVMRSGIAQGFEGTREGFEAAMNVQHDLGDNIAGAVQTTFGDFIKELTFLSDDMQQKLEGLMNRFDQALGDGRELLTLQESLRENLNDIAHIQNLSQTFQDLRQSMTALYPVLTKLSKPIPLRLSLGSVELPDAGDGSDGGGTRYEIPAPDNDE